MATTIYTRTVVTNKLDQLQSEINANTSIIPSLLSISANGTTLNFEFAAELSTEELAAFDVTVAAHVPAEDIISVSQLPISRETNKLAVQSSAKPMLSENQTYVVWTGAGDDMVTGETGAGDVLDFMMTPGTPFVQKDLHFHPMNGRVWMNEGYVRYENAGPGDYAEAHTIAPASELQQMFNLDLIVENNLVKYSSGGPGTGTHGFGATPVLIPRLYKKDGDWDWNEQTGLVPNFEGTGEYRISDIEQIIYKYFNKIPCHGTTNTYFNMASDDTAEMPQPYFMRIKFHNVSDTTWNAQCFIEMYREDTV